jgi:hypothetical protein
VLRELFGSGGENANGARRHLGASTTGVAERRIEVRDEGARHGVDAIESMGEWLAEQDRCRFAIRVIGRAADLGVREAEIAKFQVAREQDDTQPASGD